MNTSDIREEFEDWAVQQRLAYRDENGFHFYNIGMGGAYFVGFVGGRAHRPENDDDIERYGWLLDKLQQAYDGEAFESDRLSIYCRMSSQRKGERMVSAEIFWRDETDLPIGLSAAIDSAKEAV